MTIEVSQFFHHTLFLWFSQYFQVNKLSVNFLLIPQAILTNSENTTTMKMQCDYLQIYSKISISIVNSFLCQTSPITTLISVQYILFLKNFHPCLSLYLFNLSSCLLFCSLHYIFLTCLSAPCIVREFLSTLPPSFPKITSFSILLWRRWGPIFVTWRNLAIEASTFWFT